MAIIAVGSVHGSPGATTLALDLARLVGADTLLIEADPDGGSLAARLDLGVKPGLTELAGAARVGIDADDLWKFAQPAAPGVALIVAHPAAEQVQAALRAAVTHIGAALRCVSGIVVIDVGRLRPGSAALGFATLADSVVVLAANSVESVVAIHHRARLLAGFGDVQVVLAGGAPYSVTEVAAATGQSVWGVIGSGSRRVAARRRTQAMLRLLADTAAQRMIDVPELLPAPQALPAPLLTLSPPATFGVNA